MYRHSMKLRAGLAELPRLIAGAAPLIEHVPIFIGDGAQVGSDSLVPPPIPNKPNVSRVKWGITQAVSTELRKI